MSEVKVVQPRVVHEWEVHPKKKGFRRYRVIQGLDGAWAERHFGGRPGIWKWSETNHYVQQVARLAAALAASRQEVERLRGERDNLRAQVRGARLTPDEARRLL